MRRRVLGSLLLALALGVTPLLPAAAQEPDAPVAPAPAAAPLLGPDGDAENAESDGDAGITVDNPTDPVSLDGTDSDSMMDADPALDAAALTAPEGAPEYPDAGDASARFVYQGDAGWWRTDGGYSLARVGNRTVAGDFDGDRAPGIKDDIAVFYDYGSNKARIHVLLSTGKAFTYQGDAGWWRTDGGYNLAQIAGRMVAGDFNGDGRDDIAVFYDYGSNKARIHVLLSTGSRFTYQGDAGWWRTDGGYSLARVGDRMVAGDFDGDGRDDIAVFYDYGSNRARIHVLLSTGTAFAYQGDAGWWRTDGGYSLARVGDRMVAGDFDGDGRDDIAVFYDYGSNKARIHVLLSTGKAFTYQGDAGWWRTDSGYSLARVAARMVAGDFNRDGRNDVAVFYDYGANKARIHVLLSTPAGAATAKVYLPVVDR